MAFITLHDFFLLILCFIIYSFLRKTFDYYSYYRPRGLPFSLPFFGMIPHLLFHIHRFHDETTKNLEGTNGTFLFKGLSFFNNDSLVTCDPANAHYIFSTNFPNFPKGPTFKKIFDILGDGIFNADHDMWRNQRKIAHAHMGHRRFYKFLEKTSREKVKNGLIPVLEHISERGVVVDLQNLFQRFTFDSTCILIMGYDPGCLSIDFPEVEFATALNEAMVAIFYRHMTSGKLTRLLRLLRVGEEKQLMDAEETMERVISGYLTQKREEIRNKRENNENEDENEEGVDLLTSYINDHDDKFLRDTILNFLLAGRDTTSSALSWFVWLVSTNPKVEAKIREELESKVDGVTQSWKIFNIDEVNDLAYLHGALCEALRLYPPVPLIHKQPIKPDVLPSGHRVDDKLKVLVSAYAMGRMKSIWGDDCLEFKPERWITESGKIKHEPSYKFLAFNAGPRTCLGKETAFTQMKIVAATMLHNYDIRLVKGHPVQPKVSIILHMTHGLLVNLSKRWVS